MFSFVLGAVVLCALVPAMLFCANLRFYLPPPGIPSGDSQYPSISVLIPARNEENAIQEAVESVLRSTGVALEVIVMDDSSTDRTGDIVRQLAARDARVRLMQGDSLPPGWNGKQYACWRLAQSASHDRLCFMDADVRLEQDALARMSFFLDTAKADLVSGFPRQITGTFLEWLLLPLIHFALLGFLPVARMRSSTDPSLAAGCGQFLLARRTAYFASGGHAAIRATMHDGILLPRAFRQHGNRTDLADLTRLARCRMYRNARQVWQGLAKNATEGIAAPGRIVPVSCILVAGQVAPFALAIWLATRSAVSVGVWVAIATAGIAAWVPRILAAVRFRQDWRSVLLHPVGILVLLSIQWYALARKILGRQVTWKDRAYSGESIR